MSNFRDLEVLASRLFKDRGALAATASVRYAGIDLREVRLYRGSSGFFTEAGRMLELKNGKPVLDASGRPRYRRIISFSTPKDGAAFTRELVRLLRAKHPEFVP